MGEWGDLNAKFHPWLWMGFAIASRLDRFILQDRTQCNHLIGDWVGPGGRSGRLETKVIPFLF